MALSMVLMASGCAQVRPEQQRLASSGPIAVTGSQGTALDAPSPD